MVHKINTNIMKNIKLKNYAKELSSTNTKLYEGFDYVVTFGKHKGKTLMQILDESPSYVVWLAKNNVVKIPNDLLMRAFYETMSPDFEDLHSDWGCRD